MGGFVGAVVNNSRAAAISIDDFYLTAAGQAELAASNSNNGLLKLRGNAGSHDLQLGTDTLKALRSLTSSGMKAKVPRYDKSANAGFGDRADPSKWSEVEGPLKVVLFEGWMLGFEPEDEAAVTAVDPQLVAVNKNLVAYHDAWHKMIDSWVIIQVRDPVWVYTWRQQAEAAMRADGRSGMTDEQVGTHILSIKCSIRSKMKVWLFNNPNSQMHTYLLTMVILHLVNKCSYISCLQNSRLQILCQFICLPTMPTCQLSTKRVLVVLATNTCSGCKLMKIEIQLASRCLIMSFMPI
jgi:pantothenate kinase-related protein Tda10